MNQVYMNYFKDPRPTRTTVVVAKLVGEGHIEITATARNERRPKKGIPHLAYGIIRPA